jgi:UDP-N-acetylmuramoylalanine--D-glutamate ligase
VCTQAGITWINDSKATNIHATQAALSSFTTQHERKVILIAGGIHKSGDDLHTLVPLIVKYVKQLILIGQAADIFKTVFENITSTHTVHSLAEATKQASNYAVSGDTILLSPACASQDMFKNYEERGNCFKQAIKKLLNSDEIL